MNSKSKKKARQLRKRSNASKGELELAKKKRKTATALVTEEEGEEEVVHSSSESVDSSEEEDDEITIKPQHARLTRVGFNWETSDSVTVNRISSDSSDESELMDDNEVKSTEYICTSACAHTYTHALALHRFVMMIATSWC